MVFIRAHRRPSQVACNKQPSSCHSTHLGPILLCFSISSYTVPDRSARKLPNASMDPSPSSCTCSHQAARTCKTQGCTLVCVAHVHPCAALVHIAFLCKNAQCAAKYKITPKLQHTCTPDSRQEANRAEMQQSWFAVLLTVEVNSAGFPSAHTFSSRERQQVWSEENVHKGGGCAPLCCLSPCSCFCCKATPACAGLVGLYTSSWLSARPTE